MCKTSSCCCGRRRSSGAAVAVLVVLAAAMLSSAAAFITNLILGLVLAVFAAGLAFVAYCVRRAWVLTRPDRPPAARHPVRRVPAHRPVRVLPPAPRAIEAPQRPVLRLVQGEQENRVP